jgi:hypothetical protein
MRKIAILSVFLMIMGFAAAAQAYTLNILYAYLPPSDPNAFTYYCPVPVVENFEDTTLIPGLSITEVNGAGTIALGVYQNTVRASVPRYQIFNYDPGMNAFGAWFDLAGPGGPGSEIDVYIDDNNQFVMTIPRTASGQFYGFIADGTFTKVRLEDHQNPLGVQEQYALVDLAVCPIPIPPSAILLGSGLLALVGLGFRRRQG